MKHCWHDEFEYGHRPIAPDKEVRCCHCDVNRQKWAPVTPTGHGQYAPDVWVENPLLDEDCPRRPV